jgi:hypothetical protein
MSVLIYPESFLSRTVESRAVDLAWQDLPIDWRPFYYLHDHVVVVSLVIAVFDETASGRPEVALPLPNVVV